MKKLLSAVCLISSLAANAQSDSFVVNGKIAGLKDGQKVVLNLIVDKKQVKVDSAVVKDGTFTLKGKCSDKADMGRVSYEVNSMKAAIPFFTEPGTISMELSNMGMTVKGTPANDAYYGINQLQSKLYQPISELYMKSRSKDLSADDRKSLTEQIERKKDEMAATMDSATMANISNMAGVYMLSKSAMNTSFDKLRSAYGKIPAALKSRPMVKDLKGTIDKMERTSIGKPFIDFEMADMNGKKLKFSNLIKNNKVTLLDFWASWCGPCCAEMPNVVKAYNAYKAKGFNVVSVSFDSNKEKWLNAVEKFKMEWQQLSDLNAWNNAAGELYGIQAIPSTLLLDEKGIIIAKDLRGEQLTKKLEEMLGK